ncbi:D-alanyl-D-alanine carboxypeptidase [Streptomyces sp. NBC_00285]|uniref:D-alanyl-D-alanine carboxypeptidase n=1 Tax=Streptomyces sp. NBC_00285 TaxID=2975700 RepID=UPI002E28A23E|nr:D-alanyl-D-alanine carboxypeptidase [Streptomyces sp. NBC_00285]
MAGESPDRSKQHESSGEPTSGSASPVPEARSAPPDPRLAVARESISLGGVDTATRIFSVRELPTAPEEASEGPVEAGAEGSGTGRAENDTPAPEERPEPSAGRDARLRDAVAAWVSTGDDPEDTPDPADKTPKTETDTDDADDADDETEGAADAEADASSVKADTEPEAEAETEPEAEAEAEPEAEAKTDPEAEAEAETEPEADPEAEAEAEPEAEAEAEPEAEAESEPETAADADTAADTDVADTDVADAAPADDEHDPDAGDPDAPGARGTARPAPTQPQKTEDPRGKGATPKADVADTADKADTADAADGDQPPVDQPTAVFKAPRPAVDQPTTTLKIGKTAAPKPPTEAERTSKFVALKPLDEAREARPKADVTAVVPQVGPERTTQQPLPPRPPLDLLAELTNTPPPPPSPLRTVARRLKIWTPLVLLLVVVFAVVQNLRALPAPTLKLAAQQTYTFEGGEVDIPWPTYGEAALDVQGVGTFGSSGDQKPVPIASVAKVMTAYIILRDHPLKSGADGPKIKIDQAAQDQVTAKDESTVPVTAGDSITQREALTDVLIASANNVARLLARWDSGSEKEFVAKMNATAKDLGMTNTMYTDPSGLNNTTVSTAVDQVKLARTAMELPAFREVAAVMSYYDYKDNKHNNYNRLVGYNNVVGIKTGTTTSALGNLVFAAKKDVNGKTHRIIGAVVRQRAGGEDNTILSGALDAGKQLILAAQDALKSATILKKGDVVGYVDDGLGGHTPVVLTKDVTAVGWSGLKVKLSFAADDVPHTAKAGTKVGTLTVGDGDGGAVEVPVTLQKDLAEPGFADKLTRVG